MRQHTVNQVRGAIGVFLRARLETSLFQCTVDETVLRVHDGSLGVIACLFLYTGRGFVAGMGQFMEVIHALFACHVLA